MQASYRYLCASSSKDATKGAYLAAILMIIGVVVWFVPAWYAASAFPNIAEIFPNLKNPQQAAYLVVVQNLMPIGMVGLLISAIFAATMSSLDSSLNQSTGIIIRSFIKPILWKDMNEKQMMSWSKGLTALFGLLIILSALFINQLKGLSLFDIALRITSLTNFPIAIPLLLGIYIKKTPEWAPWGTIIVGAMVSAFSFSLFKDFIGTTSIEFTKREWLDLAVAVPLLCHLIFTAGFFLCSQFFYKGLSTVRTEEVDQLFKDFNTPIVLNNTENVGRTELGSLNNQRFVLGKYVLIMGVGIVLLTLIQKNISDIVIIATCAGILLSIAYLLLRSSKDQTNIIPRGK